MDQEARPQQQNSINGHAKAQEDAISLSSGSDPNSKPQAGKSVEAGSIQIHAENINADTSTPQIHSQQLVSIQEIPSQEARDAIMGSEGGRKKRVIKKFKPDLEEPPRSSGKRGRKPKVNKLKVTSRVSTAKAAKNGKLPKGKTSEIKNGTAKNLTPSTPAATKHANNLIHFFSCLAEAPITPIDELIPKNAPKPEKKLSEEEMAILSFKEQYPHYVSHANKIIYPVDDELFGKYPWLSSKSSGLKRVYLPITQPMPEYRSSISPYHLKYLMKITSFFDRFDELLQGPSFSKEELNAAIVGD